MTSPLQLFQAPAKAPCHILLHPHSGNDVSLQGSIPILSDGSKRNSDDPVFVGKLGDEIDMQRRDTVEQNDPFAVIFDFTDCAGHQAISGRGA